ncbi:hypothetical protein L208DRAFT_1331406 [Tricholoma matsutake]|nr:hypothetical protein L208DRAFT_1331406 [Tricholoma matsutake 945]
MWIISASPIDNSIRVRAFASLSLHFFCSSSSAVVGLALSADSGAFASFAIYFSSPRSRSTASILHFHGIQLWAFSNSIRYDPDLYDDSSDIPIWY